VECDEIECDYSSNPNYHLKDGAGNPLPYLRRINTIVMPDTQARFGLFRADMLDAHDITTEQRAWLASLSADAEVDEYRLYDSSAIHFRTDQAPWSDQRVRTAVNRAIDVEAVNDAVYGGRGHFSLGMAMPSPDAYLPQAEVLGAYRRNVAEARRLLESAGYPDDLDAQLWVAGYNDSFQAAAELIRAQLSDAGIRVSLVAHDPEVYVRQVYRRHGDFQDMAFGPQEGLRASDWLGAYYHSDGGRNVSRVADPDLDRIIEAQAGELDPLRRASLLQEIQRYLLDKSYQLVVRSSVGQMVSWPWVRNRAYSAGFDTRVQEYLWIDEALRP
jgi:ABC-type transport system substrate-binding protein